ncbi:hypothetical protein SEA_ERENYEAGER_118 [Microbacterium phage Erenyeager]|nr:hypothetical protein SEA_ERENYEAGER_3 [Microbacterium phage Erenyeager]WMI33988.1 hypothetical protein SEA_ERENYEAGER_118 [Microbacterium phage Erenyeager]
MATPHICHVDCELILEGTRRIHMMHAAEPSSAAGRYQWELNRAILDKGRRAWRESGQGQSRACRVWDDKRRRKLEWLGDRGMFRIRSFARLRAALTPIYI